MEALKRDVSFGVEKSVKWASSKNYFPPIGSNQFF